MVPDIFLGELMFLKGWVKSFGNTNEGDQPPTSTGHFWGISRLFPRSLRLTTEASVRAKAGVRKPPEVDRGRELLKCLWNCTKSFLKETATWIDVLRLVDEQIFHDDMNMNE